PGADECFQGDGGITQPAVSVVPVANTTDLLGQGGGGCGNDPTRGPVGQGLEGDEGADDGFSVRTVVGALVDPVLPETLGAGERLLRVQVVGFDHLGGVPGHDKGHALSRGDGEGGVVGEVVALQGDGGAVPDGVGSGAGHQVGPGTVYPRHHVSVVEAQAQVGFHTHRPAHPLDDAHHVWGASAWRHEVDDTHRPGV